MKQLWNEIIENGIRYFLRGDYYFPDLGLSESTRHAIGRYGRMRKAYLEAHRPGLYERLLLSGKLYQHVEKIDLACRNRMETLVRQMAQAEGLSEDCKAKDQLGWVVRMNSICQRAEKIVFAELIYD